MPGCQSCNNNAFDEKWFCRDSAVFLLTVNQTVPFTITSHVNFSLSLCVCVFTALQLSVKVAHVPNLSAGVTCVFEDLSESPGEVLPKGQILCMSPSLRDVPTLTHGYGEAQTHRAIQHAATWLRKAHTRASKLPFSFFHYVKNPSWRI